MKRNLFTSALFAVIVNRVSAASARQAITADWSTIQLTLLLDVQVFIKLAHLKLEVFEIR